jgi:hypothetical protein
MLGRQLRQRGCQQRLRTPRREHNWTTEDAAKMRMKTSAQDATISACGSAHAVSMDQFRRAAGGPFRP